MPTEIVMPKLGLNMDEGLLVEWLKKEGDKVHRGDALFIVETEKVTVDSTAQADGTLTKILVKAGETVPIRTVVALLDVEGEQSSGSVPSQPSSPPIVAPVVDAAPVASPQASPARSGRVVASPLAKKLAHENHIDIAVVPGSGAEGRIMVEDVEHFIQSTPGMKAASLTTVPEGNFVPIAGIRALIAERMAKSLQSTAQLTLHAEVDCTALVAYREKFKKDGEASGASSPSYNAILVSVVAKALKMHPRLNARQVDKQIQLLDEIHIGLAVDTDAGLVVVVVRDADRKQISAIHDELGKLTERALSRRSMPDDLSGSTFTISNLGMYGIDGFTPILNPPEVGILGIGRIVEKLVIQNGKISQSPVMTLSLTIDHRLVDGAPAARFLQSIGAQIGQLF